MIIDIHTHLLDGISDNTVQILRAAARFSINHLCTSMGQKWQHNPTEYEIKQANNYVLKLVNHWPKRITGFCYLNPNNENSIEEMHRCFKAGMRGIKLWVAARCNDPLVYPIIENAIKLDIPILQHTWEKASGNYENESLPRHLAEVAIHYPKAKFIMAHSGGNWQKGIRTVSSITNIIIDTAGFDPTEGFMETALKEVGPKRIVYGSDAQGRSFASQLAKINSIKMSKQTRELILYKNAIELLKINL
ncbi:MAG: amidohydrolase family protein [Planctomycetaceae bacterium]|nr:amidohydrolase family protein [Planctomycetaceae bacterium]